MSSQYKIMKHVFAKKMEYIIVFILLTIALACGGGGGDSAVATTEEENITPISLNNIDAVLDSRYSNTEGDIFVPISYTIPPVDVELSKFSGNLFSDNILEGYADLSFTASGTYSHLELKLSRNEGPFYGLGHYYNPLTRGLGFKSSNLLINGDNIISWSIDNLASGNYQSSIYGFSLPWGGTRKPLLSANFSRNQKKSGAVDPSGNTLEYNNGSKRVVIAITRSTNNFIGLEMDDFPGVPPSK